MKRLEDIEKLSVSDLERIAQDESIRVPSMLKHDISIMARTLEMASKDDEEEMSYEEIAERTGMSNLTLRVLLSNARKSLRSQI